MLLYFRLYKYFSFRLTGKPYKISTMKCIMKSDLAHILTRNQKKE